MPLGFEPQSHSNVRAVVVNGAVLLVEVVDWVVEEVDGVDGVEVGVGGSMVTSSQDVAVHSQMKPSGMKAGH